MMIKEWNFRARRLIVKKLFNLNNIYMVKNIYNIIFNFYDIFLLKNDAYYFSIGFRKILFYYVKN